MNGNNSEAGMQALPKSKEQIKKSVVKITSQGRQGTGFIVGLMSDTVYILTVSHVVASDPASNIEFFGQTREFKAKILEIEGQQENGFALLAVMGSIPSDAIPLYVANKFDLEQGDSVFTFGFPRSGGDWAYDELSYSSRIAREILFSGSDMKEGNSGSPLIKGDEVVGMVTSVTDFAHANSSVGIREFLQGAKGGNIVLEHMETWQKETMPKPETPAPDIPTKYSEKAENKQKNQTEVWQDSNRQPDSTWQEETPVIRDKLKDGSLGPEMVRIPTGTFQMGSNDRYNDKYMVSVKRFYMGKYEVTFEEYDKFCEATGRDEPKDNGWGRGKRPVINVSWNNAKAYTKWLSKQTGEDYRLPSEAQWEYACRAGSVGEYSFGDDKSQLGNYGWYGSNAGGKTHTVGEKQANKFGLYDMHGNVWEWLEDKLHNERAPVDGSAWVGGDTNYHLVAGGSWFVDDIYLRCANSSRYGSDTSSGYDNIGIRLVRM